MKRKPNKLTGFVLLIVVAMLLFMILRQSGENAGAAPAADPEEMTLATVDEVVSSEEISDEPFETEQNVETEVESEGSPEAEEPADTGTSGDDNKDPAKDGIYTSAEEVSLYIHLYGELPDNYITKKEAKALGWEGGSLEAYAPGKMIGGDRFGNYEGILPEDQNYTECDIDTMGKKSRGAKRLVFDGAGNIYYTEDHYESFTQLYDADGPIE